MKITSTHVVDTMKKLGAKAELQWPTLTWLLCDLFMVIASDARLAISEAVSEGHLIHDRGWLKLP